MINSNRTIVNKVVIPVGSNKSLWSSMWPKPINLFCFLLYSFYLPIYRGYFFQQSFFFKWIGQKLRWSEFCEIGVLNSLTGMIMRFNLKSCQRDSKLSQRGWLARLCELICKYFINYLIKVKSPFSFYLKPAFPCKVVQHFHKPFIQIKLFRIFWILVKL